MKFFDIDNKRLGGTECRQGLPAREAVVGGAPTGSWREATEGWKEIIKISFHEIFRYRPIQGNP